MACQVVEALGSAVAGGRTFFLFRGMDRINGGRMYGDMVDGLRAAFRRFPQINLHQFVMDEEDIE